ncbi:unnamed protein product [Lactuca virosa]|uniref:t-SNARE coiled-coil homology domain-containing protein n=1 Tax=Lactuca virosa TaxID=75947 RepID=A0AAU9P7N4_9ASTR|nr:unnamed protein product [Lactuca virosa]
MSFRNHLRILGVKIIAMVIFKWEHKITRILQSSIHRKQYEKLNKLLKKLQDAHEESKVVTKAAVVKAIKQRMEKDVDEVGKIARFIKSKIEELDKENLANRQKPGCGKGTGVDRESIHQEHCEVVKRHVYIVTGTRADEETIDQLIEIGDSEQIFQKAVREQGRGQVLDTLAEIQERHDAIFMDMVVLVDAQEEMLDNTETQVSSAVDHVQDGNKALYKAKSPQKNSRKWMCIAILILLIIIAVVVVGVLKPWKSGNGSIHRKQYEKLNKLLKKLQDAHEESKVVTKAAAVKGCSYFYMNHEFIPFANHRMELDVDEVGKIAKFIKSKIEELDKENMANRQKPRCGKGTRVDWSRTATTLSLKKKFKDKMYEFQALRESIHQEHLEVVERRVYTVTGTRADEVTIDQLIETGDSKQIFQKAIREQGRGQVLDTLAEIQERHDAVREVEKKLLDLKQVLDTLAEIQERHDAIKEVENKLLDLQQIFMDMAVLVDAQGEMLDNIETHVSSAVDHVQYGNKALYKAKSLQKNSRKWMHGSGFK